MKGQETTLETLKAPVRFKSPLTSTIYAKFSPVLQKQKRVQDIFLSKEDRIRSFELYEDSSKQQNIFKEDIVETEEKEKEEEEETAPVIRRRSNSHLDVKRTAFLNLLKEEIENEEKNENHGLNVTDLLEPKRRRKRNEAFNFEYCSLNKLRKTTIIKPVRRKRKERQRDKNVIINKPIEGLEKTNKKIIDSVELVSFSKNENQRLKVKIKKVRKYWMKKSLIIPNALQLTHSIERDQKNLIEFQDYSKKSVLIHGPNKKIKPIKEEMEEEVEEESERSLGERSVQLVLNSGDEKDVFPIN